MRPPTFLLVTLLAATLLPVGQRSASASCAAPTVADADDLVLRRGATVQIDGVGFVDGCQDTGSCTISWGCSRCDHGPEPLTLRDLTLRLRSDGRTWALGVADARSGPGDLGAVTWTVDVPQRVAVGRAVLRPERGQPVVVRVR
ncbi:hypothetical protein G7072_08965 [Nocardioides sp. HDW12B]|uniref:hypothetical protein n=1 Tax=Nocardioides sp. HDW12B TaxID=2714939 RepID=UPI00140B463F|nr:hypothetical protein [Nocardioides sp. HDW12B]QIK66463.1 hypothetical protein G7072_08965 [Nocardioides sp. HDW12B]